MKLIFFALFFMATLFPSSAYSEEVTESELDETETAYSEPGDPKAAKKILDTISGVYKRKFDNGTVSGEKFQSEDILEVVPVTDDAAYMKIHLEFYNAHLCNIAGIFQYKKVGGFVFQDPDDDDYKCTLTVKLENDALTFDDPGGACRKVCGARGGFSGDGFSLKQRRTIRYMPVILKSEEYKAAVAQLGKK